MTRYRRKPTEIEAVQWDGAAGSVAAIRALGALFAPNPGWTPNPGVAALRAGAGGAQGWVDVPLGHWIAKGGEWGGERDFWPIDPAVFAATYEPVDAGDEGQR